MRKSRTAKTATKSEDKFAAFDHRFKSDSAPHNPANIATAYRCKSGVLEISNGAEAAQSNGFTEGFSIRVPDELEAAASERAVRVEVKARSANGEPSRFAMAYSTCDVGNSGWRWFEVGSAATLCSFEYQVPKMDKGNGDYVGILGAPEGEPPVLVGTVRVTVI